VSLTDSLVDTSKWRDDVIRVVVCEDQALRRRRLIVALEGTDDIDVVAEAAESVQAVDVCTDHAPDVALVAMDLAGAAGPGTAAAMRAQVPACRIVMLLSPGEVGEAVDAIRAGATGFISRDGEQQAPAVLRAVCAGTAALPPLVSQLLLEDIDRVGDASGAFTGGRDRVVLEHLAAGRSYAAAAQTLGVADFTAKNLLADGLERLARGVVRADRAAPVATPRGAAPTSAEGEGEPGVDAR
jgi:two-component system response regulator DesR